jgi:maltose O-acetyltransferase
VVRRMLARHLLLSISKTAQTGWRDQQPLSREALGPNRTGEYEMSPLESDLQKMLGGQLYCPWDPELVSMQKRARRLTRAYNHTTEDEPDRRTEILREMLGGLGQETTIEPPFFCDFGSHIYLGQFNCLNTGCAILDGAEVRFGDHVGCGPNVQIYTATHPLDAKLREVRDRNYAKPIRIGSHVWIGGASIICPGVSIGDNTTIGPGSVVAKDIPANVFAAGNPCRVVSAL